jgi:hypothetical protein
MVVVVVVGTGVVAIAGSVHGLWFSGLNGCEGPKAPAVVPAVAGSRVNSLIPVRSA